MYIYYLILQIESRVNHQAQQMNNNEPEPEHRGLDNGDHVSIVYILAYACL